MLDIVPFFGKHANVQIEARAAFTASHLNAGLNEAAIAEKIMPTASLSLAHSRGVAPPIAVRLQRHKASIENKAQRMKLDCASEANNNVIVFVLLEASRSLQFVDPVKIKELFS